MPSFALEVEKVTDNVYALVGETGQRSATNFGNHATFGVIVTNEGVVLIDSGATWKGAQQIEQTIRTITKQPVKLVINTGGQDHRWLGNDYFKEKGAKFIASNAAVEDQRKRYADQINALSAAIGDENVEGTQLVFADVTFDDQYEVSLGGTSLLIRRVGPAHTPGDSAVWLPKEKVVFSGDVIYAERMLGVLTFSNSRHWLEAFDSIAAWSPDYIVPGHGVAHAHAGVRAACRAGHQHGLDRHHRPPRPGHRRTASPYPGRAAGRSWGRRSPPLGGALGSLRYCKHCTKNPLRAWPGPPSVLRALELAQTVSKASLVQWSHS